MADNVEAKREAETSGHVSLAARPSRDVTSGDVTGPARTPLDNVMIAMDVVDTIRHDERIVARELDDDKRRSQLIERLREIYRGQGIDVPDRILEDGVKALEEQRFVYEPPKPGLGTWLAKLYVTRWSWGQYVIGAAGAVLALWLAWLAVVEWPRERAAENLKTELGTALPRRLNDLRKQIMAETQDRPTLSWTAQTAVRGASAASSGNAEQARDAARQLEEMLAKLRAVYEVRIVSRKGEVSGFWRVPRVNPQGRNYYLVVEAVDAAGRVVPQSIENEETRRRETVKKWAVRVPREVLERVRADKAADGIVNQAVVAVKNRGKPEADWRIERAGGAVTEW